jgi:hypothetical protein
MNLFKNELEELNILPKDGEVKYYDGFFDKVESYTYFEKLKNNKFRFRKIYFLIQLPT